MMRHDNKATSRINRGNAITEFGPVLIVLFVIIAFPMIDMLAIALVYNAGSTLNATQVREAALEPRTSAQDPVGQVMKTIPDKWQSDGLGQFCKLAAPPTTKVSYTSGASGDFLVNVTTTIVASPLVPIPFFPGIPGITAPITFTYSNDHLLENPDNYLL